VCKFPGDVSRERMGRRLLSNSSRFVPLYRRFRLKKLKIGETPWSTCLTSPPGQSKRELRSKVRQLEGHGHSHLRISTAGAGDIITH